MISLLIALFSALRSSDIIYCDIKGNVKNPGVYKMEQGEVINDLIEKAGGLKKNSYVKNINLSKRLNDEMVVYILSNNEYKDLIYVCPKCICEKKDYIEETTTNKTNKATTNTIKNNTTTTINPSTSKVVVTTKVKETTTNNILININTASLDELMKLNGIGEKIALKIINYREENIFETVEDIKNVSGIGESLFAKIKEYITV